MKKNETITQSTTKPSANKEKKLEQTNSAKDIQATDTNPQVITDISTTGKKKTATVIDYKEDTSTVKPVSKDPLDKVKKEDLVVKLKELEDKLKAEKEEKKKQIDAKNKELESKDKVIFTIGSTNKKLVNELDELRKEVDEKLDKIGLKQIKDTEKEIEMKKKQQPLEQLLKIKEKELKNTVALLEVFRKDKENLQKNLNEKSDYKNVVNLQDKLKEEESKNSQLELEVKALMKIQDEHNKCQNNREDTDKEKKQMINEIKFLKEKNKELIKKNKDDDDKYDRLLKLYNESKAANLIPINSQPKVDLPNINNFNSKSTVNMKTTKNSMSSEKNIQKYWNMLESADKVNSKDDTAIGRKKPHPKNDREYKEFLQKERHKFSLSLQNKNFRIENGENRVKLLGNEEKQILTKLLPAVEITKLEKKFEAIEVAKFNLEKKYMIDTKAFAKKMSDLEDRLEMTLLHNKETEQKNKILSYQINEHRNENKILSRKLIEMNNKLKNLAKSLQEKEEENKKLIFQVHDQKRQLEEFVNNSRSYHESKRDHEESHLTEDKLNTNEDVESTGKEEEEEEEGGEIEQGMSDEEANS